MQQKYNIMKWDLYQSDLVSKCCENSSAQRSSFDLNKHYNHAEYTVALRSHITNIIKYSPERDTADESNILKQDWSLCLLYYTWHLLHVMSGHCDFGFFLRFSVIQEQILILASECSSTLLFYLQS